MAILHELVATADVVQHNMRYDAAVRLGVDYESLREIKPDLIYCHTRGFEHGERELLPGNDQTGAALAGPDWLDGGLDHDGMPLWPVISLGDTGNGFLSAIAMVQALYHRDRTGEGQFVDTSIIYAQLLNASIAWITPDGSRHGDRPQLDAMQLGWNALLPPLRDRRRLAVRRRGRPTSSARAARPIDRSDVGERRPTATAFDALEPAFSDPHRRTVVRRPRRGRRAVRGLDARLRARPLRRSRDDRARAGSPSTSTRSSAKMDAVRAALRLVGDAGRRAGPAAHAGPGHPRDPARARLRRRPASTSSPKPKVVLDTSEQSAEPMPVGDPPVARTRRPVLLGRRRRTGSCSSSAAPRCGTAAAPAGADVRRLPLARVGHAGVVAGTGTVYTWIVSHHPTEPDDEPRIVVAGRARRGRALRVQPHRRRRRRGRQRHGGRAELRGRSTASCSPSSGPAASRRRREAH